MLIDSCMNCPNVRVDYKITMVSGRKMSVPRRAYCKKLSDFVVTTGMSSLCPLSSDEE